MNTTVTSDELSLSASPIGPIREVWAVAWPTVLTMTSYTVMQFADKLMIGQVGPLEVAAQGNGGIWAFTPIAIGMGILTVVNTFVSQNLGAGRPKEGPAYAWAAIWLAIAFWLLVLMPWAVGLPLLFATMGHGEELQRLEVHYGQILLFGAAVLLAGRGLHHYFFGLHRPKVVAASAIVGNIANVAFNYILIFGEDGIPGWGMPGVPGVPALGLYGAAIGTVLGTVVELAIPLVVFIGPSMHVELDSRASWRPQWKPMRDLLTLGWPAAAQFGNEIVCWSIFMTALVGTFGEDHMTAGWIALGYMHLSFMPAIGFSVAVTSLVGRYIGAGQPDVTAARARLGLKMALSYMAVCAIIFFVFRRELIDLFLGSTTASPEHLARIVDIGAKLMICAAVFQVVDAFGIVYTGALRGAGDTVWPGVVTMIYSWTFIVLGGWILVRFAPQLESVGPWMAASTYIIIYGVTMAVRFESGRWRSIRLLEPGEAGPAAESAKVAPLVPGPPAGTAGGAVRDVAEGLGESLEDDAAPQSAGAAD